MSVAANPASGLQDKFVCGSFLDVDALSENVMEERRNLSGPTAEYKQIHPTARTSQVLRFDHNETAVVRYITVFVDSHLPVTLFWIVFIFRVATRTDARNLNCLNCLKYL